MAILDFFKKKKEPELPAFDTTESVETTTGMPEKRFPEADPNFKPAFPETPNFPSNQVQDTNMQLVIAKLDLINQKLENVDRRLQNIEQLAKGSK